MQSCPLDDKLSDYVLGKLSDEESKSIADHLKDCSDCLSQIDNVDDSCDEMVRKLRNPTADDRFINELGCQTAVDQARRVAREYEADFGVLRDYRLIEKLGQGGMGTVYGAVHTKLDRPVAVKVLPTERMQNSDAVSRFEREMKAIGKLHHPNIVQAHDAGEADGKHYLVMERVEGLDLSALVKRLGKLPVADACEIIRQASVGLQHAHEQDLVHRDIKPSNIMVTPAGDVKILDLGLALLDELPGEGHELTSTGQIMGTLDYMAPEQLGDSHEVDLRADIYSLGATLYQLLTGQAPYASRKYNTPQKKLMAIATKPVTPVGDLRDDIPQRLGDVLDRMLAKNPDDRFSAAEEVAEVLEHLCGPASLAARITEASSSADQTLADPQDSTIDPIKSSFTDTQPSRTTPELQASPLLSASEAERRGRWRLIPIAIAVCFLFFIAASTVFYVTSGNATLIVTLDDIEVAVELKKYGLIVRDKNTGREYKISKPGETKLAAGEYFLSVTDDAGLDVDTEKFTLTRNGREIVTVRMGNKNKRSDGELDAGDPLSSVTLVTRPVRIPGVISWSIETLGHRGYNHAATVEFSPDTSVLAIGDSAGTIRLRDEETGRLLKALIGHDDAVRDVAFSRDGRLLASVSADNTIRVWDVQSGHCAKILREQTRNVQGVHWLSNETLATVGDAATFRRWDLASGNSIPIKLDAMPADLRTVGWSSDGLRFATGGNSGDVTVWDIKPDRTSSRKMPGEKLNAPVASIHWSPDGKQLAAADAGSSVRIWDTTSGKVIRSIDAIGPQVAWSPNGKRLAAGGAIWDMETGQKTMSLDGGSIFKNFHVVAWAPNGERLVGARYLGQFCTWDTDTGERINTFPHHPAARHNTYAWLADGEMVASWVKAKHMRIWDIRLASSRSIGLPFDGDRALAASSTSDEIVSYNGNPLSVIDLNSGRSSASFQMESAVFSAAWAPEGRTLALGLNNQSIRLIKPNGQLIKTLLLKSVRLASDPQNDVVHQFAFSSDATTLAAMDRNTILRVWDIGTGELKATFDVANLPHAVGSGLAFSPDDTLLAAGSSHDVVLFEHGSGKKHRTLEGHKREVTSISWRPDGTLISHAVDGTLRLWDVHAENPLLRTIPAIRSPVHWSDNFSVSFSADGRFHCSGGNGVTRVMDVDTSRAMTFVALTNNQHLAISDNGHFRGSPGIENQIVYVVQTENSQDTLTPGEFAIKYGWTNDPDSVSLSSEGAFKALTTDIK